jgi:hypothetical protein
MFKFSRTLYNIHLTNADNTGDYITGAFILATQPKIMSL